MIFGEKKVVHTPFSIFSKQKEIYVTIPSPDPTDCRQIDAGRYDFNYATLDLE
jgi:hypothetical protein